MKINYISFIRRTYIPKPFVQKPMNCKTMNEKIIDGKMLASQIRCKLKEKTRIINQQYGRSPGLAVLMAGNRKDSETYVRMKKMAAAEIGIVCNVHQYPSDITEEALNMEIDVLNRDVTVDGIIVQLPLPPQINKYNVLSRIDITKDVDGFHVNNMGALALEGYEPMFMPCTPRGVMELLDYYKIPVEGKHVVILGKSNIVGLPLAFMMMKRNATVTVCNHMTQNEENITRQADILVSAVGIPGLVKPDWVKDGVIVVDVGINSIVINPINPNPINSNSINPNERLNEIKYKIVGDVDSRVFEKALLMTPVPGGVGPMTVAMLMKATVESSLKRMN